MSALAMLLLMAGLLAITAGKPASAQSDPGGSPSGSGEDPIFVQGNPSCATLSDTILPGSHYEFKINNAPENRTYTDTNNNTGFQVTISNSNRTYFDYQTLPNMGVDAVIVKGGPNADAYVYDLDQESTGDTRLHAPVNDPTTGRLHEVSHVSFCYDLDDPNDPPVNSVPGSQNINEDQARVFSAANGNRISISDPDAGSDDVKVTLTAAHGKLTLGSVAGLLFSSGDGNDDSSMTFTGSISAINTALNLLTFTPDANYSGPDAKFTILTNDQGNNGSGGEKTDSDSVAFNITPQNDPPVIDSVVVTNTNPVEEGSPATIVVTATDPDTPSSELRYSFDCDNKDPFEKGPQAANSAECTYFDNGTYKVNVKVTDSAGDSDTDSTNVTVVNVAPAATFDAAPNSLDEGQSIDLSLTDVVDPGTEDTYEYRFDCGDGNGFGASSATHDCPTTDDGRVTVKG